MIHPSDADVAELRDLLDMLDSVDNEQKARYLLASDWLRNNDARLAEENAHALDKLRRRLACHCDARES